MQRQLISKFILLPLGIALLLAGLFFKAGNAQSTMLQGTPVPTEDRLAEPTLPPNPSQADHGAQVYWLSCLPCHGDKGQGLTDEFRTTYPEEEQNCWKSGCHGKNPYESGFTIPKKIPAVIGDTALAKFSNAAQLHAFIRAAMPFWKPGSLSKDDSWKVTAFLLRENKLWNDDGELNDSNAGSVVISRAEFITPVAAPAQNQVQKGIGSSAWIILIGSLLVLFILVFALKIFRNRAKI